MGMNMRDANSGEVRERFDECQRVNKRIFRNQLYDVSEGIQSVGMDMLTWPIACSRLRIVRIVLNNAETNVGSATLSIG